MVPDRIFDLLPDHVWEHEFGHFGRTSHKKSSRACYPTRFFRDKTGERPPSLLERPSDYHRTFFYEIYGKNAEKRWIVILSNDERDCEEPTAFFNFMERVNASGDDPGLHYRWDQTFGISVTYPETVTEDQAVTFLSRYAAA